MNLTEEDNVEKLIVDAEFAVRGHFTNLPLHSTFYLYGAGNVGIKLADGLRAKGFEICGFIDNNSVIQNTYINGIKVFAPLDIHASAQDVCIVCIWNYKNDPIKTKNHATAMGFGHVIHFAAAALIFALDRILPNYAIDHPRTVFNEKTPQSLELLNTFFEDKLSLTVAKTILNFHALPIFENIPILVPRLLPFNPSSVKTYIDGGAFTGDRFATHLKIFPNLECARLIEPDPSTFITLSKKKFPEICDILAIRAALSDSVGHVSFEAQHGLGSKAVESKCEGSINVSSTTLDKVCNELNGPIYVKLNVEGFELNALKGAIKLLQRDDTIFSITLEHKSVDIFEIPSFLVEFKNRVNYLCPLNPEICMALAIFSIPKVIANTSHSMFDAVTLG